MITLNMDPPKKCYECKFGYPFYIHVFCFLTDKSCEDNNRGRPKYCPFRKGNEDVRIDDIGIKEFIRKRERL